MASGRTRRKPRYEGSIRNCNVTPLEYKEYQQTGMIRVKETPAEGYYFHKWEWGYHRCSNFGDIIGGHEVFKAEVKDFEPMNALDGGEDGLDFYRAIVEQGREWLKDGGWLFFEIGYDQGEDLRNLLQEFGYTAIEIRQDLAGLDRVAMGRKGEA